MAHRFTAIARLLLESGADLDANAESGCAEDVAAFRRTQKSTT